MNAEKFFEQFEAYVDFQGGVQSLRDQIMMAMIQGKLVKHDPSEEPATVLLERARKEKQSYLDAKKVAKADPIPQVDPAQLPFTLPGNWTWSRWGDFILDVEHGPQGAAKPGDFVVARTSPDEHIGKSAVLAKPGDKPPVGEEVMRLRMSEAVDPRFFNITNNSPAGRGYYASQAVAAGGSLKKIETTAVTHMPFPIPPRAEQARIVEKVTQLMALCDQLEERQRRRNELRAQLLQKAVHDLLEEG
jgi:type I restriction enzyme S subunit